jgi:hypothetical protein
VGIFKRKNGPVDLGRLQEERYKLLCRELQIAVESEYQSLSEIMKLDGRDPDSVAYENRTLEILSTVNRFLNEILGAGFGDQKLPPEWGRSLELVHSPDFIADPRSEKYAAELIEVSTYYVNSVKSGNFVMMPNANLANSKNYRSYLLGNNLNGDLNWGWSNDPHTPREAIDSTITQIIAKTVTSILDKVGNGKTLEAACAFGVAICLLWEKSGIRSEFN